MFLLVLLATDSADRCPHLDSQFLRDGPQDGCVHKHHVTTLKRREGREEPS